MAKAKPAKPCTDAQRRFGQGQGANYYGRDRAFGRWQCAECGAAIAFEATLCAGCADAQVPDHPYGSSLLTRHEQGHCICQNNRQFYYAGRGPGCEYCRRPEEDG